VYAWIERCSDGVWRARWKREEGGFMWRVGDVVVRVNVRKMGRVGEVAVEKKGKQEVLDLWREEGGENIETYLWSGRI
jgi:hypothetical protein